MTVGRISGPLLKENLTRDGVNLRFENDLLYLLVSDTVNPANHKIGIKTQNPAFTLDVNGTTNSTNYRGGYARIDDVQLNDRTVSTVAGNLILKAATVNDQVIVQNNVRVEGNLHATGNITADGSLTFGDSNTDNIVFNADVNSDIIPDVDDTYNLGSLTKSWKEIYVDDMRLGGPQVPGDTTFVETTIPGAGDTPDIVFKGLTDLNYTKISNTNTDGHLALSANGIGLIELVSKTRIHNDLNVLGKLATDSANYILMGEPVYGLLDGAVEMTDDTSLTDGVAQLNQVLTLLVPPAPIDFPGSQSLLLLNLEQRIMNQAQASQPLNGNAITAPAVGTIVWVARVSTFSTSSIVATGPGTLGTLRVYRNTVESVSKRLTFGNTTQAITSKFTATTNGSNIISYDQPKVGVLAIGYLIKTGSNGAFGGLTTNTFYYIKSISAKTLKLALYDAVTGTIGADFVATSTGTGILTFEAFNDNGDFIANNTTLKVTNNVASPADTPGFFETVDLQVTGTNVVPGWNTVKITHDGITPTAETSIGGNTTRTGIWYYDDSLQVLPQFSNQTFAIGTSSIIYSSTVPHYTSSTTYNIGFTITWNGGKTGHNSQSDNIITSTVSGPWTYLSPNTANKTYTDLGYTVLPTTTTVTNGSGPNSKNFIVNVVTGFGVHNTLTTVPSFTASNGYLSAGSALPALNARILYKTGTSGSSSFLEETNIGFHSAISGTTGGAARCVNPDAGTAGQDTPVFTAGSTLFVSQTGTFYNTDATVVANVLQHDTTNYSTGYLPAGPNLSVGRSGSQYFTFRFTRTGVSKFSITYTTNSGVAAIFCAMPGTGGTSGTTSSLNKWLDLRIDNSLTNGCALGGNMDPSAAGTRTYNCSFGILSSTNSTNNEIWVRIKLTSGQSITSLTIGAATI